MQSPDGKFTFNLKLSANTSDILYEVKYENENVIDFSQLGFKFKGYKFSENPLLIREVETNSVHASWEPAYGERNEYPDVYNEALVSFSDGAYPFRLLIRAYNEGVAFRYEFADGLEGTKIKEEKTEFKLPVDARVWVSEEAQSRIFQTRVSQVKEIVDRPVLLEYQKDLFVALGEANLVDFARMKFENSKPGSTGLGAKLDGYVIIGDSFNSPWRFVMAARSPARILENNYLLLNLNEANKIENSSWIKPGKVIREVTLTTQGGMACVDFAVKHNLQYIEFDAGWYGNEHDNKSDATTVTVDPKRSPGPLDLQRVINYGNDYGIGIILYVNRRALEKQLDEVLPLTKSWGVKGLKYGFVNVGSQEWTAWLHNAVRKAAKQKLMVDIHDEYRPTGYSRTYPNLMTQEGIRGDEESTPNDMTINTIFTRMIAGAGDQTNCYFNERVTLKMGSHTGQMAKVICIYSPWQFLYWYDRPAVFPHKEGGAGGSEGIIQEIPDLAFFDQVPTSWDDTKIIDGYPGKVAIVARKKERDWFLGVLTGVESYDQDIKLSFLDKGITYKAEVYSHDESLNTQTNVRISEMEVSSESVLKYDIAQQNGLAVILKPVKK